MGLSASDSQDQASIGRSGGLAPLWPDAPAPHASAEIVLLRASALARQAAKRKHRNKLNLHGKDLSDRLERPIADATGAFAPVGAVGQVRFWEAGSVRTTGRQTAMWLLCYDARQGLASTEPRMRREERWPSRNGPRSACRRICHHACAAGRGPAAFDLPSNGRASRRDVDGPSGLSLQRNGLYRGGCGCRIEARLQREQHHQNKCEDCAMHPAAHA